MPPPTSGDVARRQTTVCPRPAAPAAHLTQPPPGAGPRRVSGAEVGVGRPLPAPLIAVRWRDETRIFDARRVTSLVAAQGYALFMADGEEQLAHGSLAVFARRLADYHFVMVHRARLVNLALVARLVRRGRQWWLVMRDGSTCQVGRRHVDEVIAALARGPITPANRSGAACP